MNFAFTDISRVNIIALCGNKVYYVVNDILTRSGFDRIVFMVATP